MTRRKGQDSMELLFTRPDFNLQAILPGRVGTGVLFVIRAEGAIGPVEIDENLFLWQGFDEKVAAS